MKKIKASIMLLRYNLSSLIVYEILIKILSCAFFIPFMFGMLNVSVKFAGIGFLTKNTVDDYFKSPVTYMFLFAGFLIMSAALLVNLSGVIYALQASNVMKKVNPLSMLLNGIKNAIRIFKVKNFPMLLYIMVLLPVTNSATVSVMFISGGIPGYFFSFIKEHRVILVLFCVAYIILTLISLVHIFTLHYFVIRKTDFKESFILSRKLIEIYGLKPILGILAWNLSMLLIALLLGGVLSTVVFKILKLVFGAAIANSLVFDIIQTLILSLYMLFSVVVIPLSYAYMSNSFFDMEHDDYDDDSRIFNNEKYNPEKSAMIERAVIVLVIMISIVLDVSYYLIKNTNMVQLDAEYAKEVTITAHRGDSSNAPENTLPAFEKAIENGADVIEFDVHQCKSGEIVVTHDDNIKRVTGVDATVGSLTYDELLELDFGGYYSEDYAGTRIPTLKEVIVLNDGECDLNIELKPEKTDVSLCEDVAWFIKEYDLYDSCVVTSLDYNSIARIKQIDSRIKTVYVMAVAMGDFYDLEYADAFSINYNFIDDGTVKESHMRGKEVYAWTINDETAIKDMMLKGVDSIITDDPAWGKEVADSFSASLFEMIYKRYFVLIQ